MLGESALAAGFPNRSSAAVANKIELSPVTRIEGHLAITTDAEAVAGLSGSRVHKIVRARCRGEMYRGFETLLRGRDPLDAQQVVQRICGVCPIPHGLASIRAQEMAYAIKPSPNGRLLQDLILAADTLQSHVLHFYQFCVPDFVDAAAITKYSGQDRALAGLKAWVAGGLARAGSGLEPYPAAPLLPQDRVGDSAEPDLAFSLLAHYLEALEMRRLADEMGAVFAARMPHSTSIVPGGCTQAPTEEGIGNYRSRLRRIAEFLDRAMLPDVIALARAFPRYWEIGAGYGHMLCYGGWDSGDAGQQLLAPGAIVRGRWEPLDVQAIAEHVGCSWFSSPSRLHPSQGETKADPRKAAGYSWLKAPRYKGLPMEVGPLARVLVNYRAPHPWPERRAVDDLLGRLGVGPEKLVSVLGRLVCRAFEATLLARQASKWLDRIDPNGPPAQDFKRVKSGSGFGLVEAPRGALGHWLSIEDGKIKHYQCVVPTTWNCSPQDDAGQPGPLEKALEGLEVADAEHPVEVGRVVRSFDPCMACAVH
jgi:ferredoxin hydrogenase large subunit/hydrogenase large subunit